MTEIADVVMLGETESTALIRMKHLYGATHVHYTPGAARLDGVIGRIPMCALEALDTFYLPCGLDITDIHLACFDVDGTLLKQETFAQLEAYGLGDGLSAITEQAMRGDIGFEQALRERVRRLKGVPLTKVEEAVHALPLQDGVMSMMAYLHQHHIPVVLLTGGFVNTLGGLVDKLGVAHIEGNTLEVDEAGRLTGQLVGSCFDGQAKAQALLKWAKHYGTTPAYTLAVGDGANDIEMLKVAGVRLGYRPKPVLRSHCQGAFEFATYESFPMLFLSSYPD